MTSEELVQIAEEVNANRETFDFEVNVCVALGCLSQHSDKLKDALKAEAAGVGVVMDRCLFKEHSRR